MGYGSRHSPIHTINTYNIAAVGATSNVFSYDMVWAENRKNHIPFTERSGFAMSLIAV